MSVLGFEWRDARFALSYVKMMFRDKFVGSSLGIVWAVASPILMLGIFTFVFGFVFRSKLPGAETSLSYVIWLISGYGPWLAISEGINASASSVLGNAQLIKNIKMKPELLAISGAAMGSVPLAVAIVYLIALLVVSGSEPHLSWLLIPVIVMVQFLIVAGIGMACAAFAVFWRDIIHIMPNLLMIIMFSTPIFYPMAAMPEIVQSVSGFNPIYILSEWYRQPLLNHTYPPIWTFIYLLVISLGVFVAGLFVFRRLKPYFESRL